MVARVSQFVLELEEFLSNESEVNAVAHLIEDLNALAYIRQIVQNILFPHFYLLGISVVKTSGPQQRNRLEFKLTPSMKTLDPCLYPYIPESKYTIEHTLKNHFEKKNVFYVFLLGCRNSSLSLKNSLATRVKSTPLRI